MGTPVNILIVEDSKDDALMIVRELKKNTEYEVFQKTVSEFDEFKEELSRPTKKWDLILSDFKLSSFNGLDVLKCYKDFQCEIPLVLISGHIGEEISRACMIAGVKDCILKNELERLNIVISREIHRKRQLEKLRDVNSDTKQLLNQIISEVTSKDFIKNCPLLQKESAYVTRNSK